MGTRSLTTIKEGGKRLLTLRCQYDGYPSGVGKQLADFMTGCEIVDGLPDGGRADGAPRLVNGAGCFAAALVASLKTEPGVWYVTGPDKDQWQEYEYEISVIPPKTSFAAGAFRFTVREAGVNGRVLFKGKPSGFAAFLALHEA